MDPSENSLSGHSCNNCGCGWEHGCVCGWCDMTPEEEAAMMKWYEEQEKNND